MQRSFHAGSSKTKPVWEENTGWYRIGKGQWVSKSVTKACQSQPITPSMLNRFFGFSNSYDDCSEWMVTPVGKKGFYLCFDGSSLRLGRLFGNILVFKYLIGLNVTALSEADQYETCLLDKKFQSGYAFFTLRAGGKYFTELRHGSQTWSTLNVAMFTDRVVEALFEDVIKRNVICEYYLYSDLLSGQWANYELG